VYWWWHVPVPSKAVLLIGVIAVVVSFMKLKAIHKSMWLGIVFILALIENKAINADHADAEARTVKLTSTVGKTLETTNTTLERVQQTLDTEKQTQGIVSALSSRIDDVDSGIRTAKRNNDAATVAQLEAQRASLQRQIVMAMASGIAKEMAYWGELWRSEDNELSNKQRDAQDSHQSQQADAFSQQRRAIATQYSTQLRPLLTSANYVREELLKNSELTDRDRADAAVFNRALSGQGIAWKDMWEVSLYFNSLVAKAQPIADKP
jgi:hypothetical protein